MSKDPAANTPKRKITYSLVGSLAMVVLIAVMLIGGVAGISSDAVSAATGKQSKTNDAVSKATTKDSNTNDSTKNAAPIARTNSQTNGIFSRTTTRVYSSKQVDEKLINKIIQAGFASPAAGAQYANEYIIVNDRAVMKKMTGGNPYSQALDTAPVVIVIASNANKARYKDLLMLDAGIATQSIMIEASELGLSSVPLSIAPVEKRIKAVGEALNLPEGVTAQMMVAIGYPALDGKTSASVNYYNKAAVHYNNW